MVGLVGSLVRVDVSVVGLVPVVVKLASKFTKKNSKKLGGGGNQKMTGKLEVKVRKFEFWKSMAYWNF